MKENPSDSDYIFTYKKGNSKGQNIKPKEMEKEFKSLKEIVVNDLVDKEIEFRHIKKAGVSEAVYVLNDLQLKFLHLKMFLPKRLRKPLTTPWTRSS